MRKTTLLTLLFLLIGLCTFSQTLEQNANWPNPDWSLAGNYNSNSNALEANPLITSSFSYDDADAGYTFVSNIAAQSPTIDLTEAFNSNETWIFIDTDYLYNNSYNDYIQFEYWDDDAQSWTNWGDALTTDTYSYAYNNYCNYTKTSFTSEHLNIADFSENQLSNFRYRIYFTDAGYYSYGFCFNSPTIYSQAPPACPSVTELNAQNTTATTVDISWTENGSATYWNIDYGPVGFSQGTGNSIVATSNPFTLTNLQSNTDYEFYVQSNCILDLGDWVGPFSFSTLCPIYDAPYTQDFESYSTPQCWNQGINNYENWYFSDYNNNVNTAGNTLSGNHFAYIDNSYTHSSNTTLITPLIDLSALTTPALHFFLTSSAQGYVNVDFSVDFFDGTTWHEGVFTNNEDTDGWELISIDLSSYTITGPVQARFIADESNTNYTYDDVAIDDVKFDELDFCFPALNLAANYVAPTQAEITWDDLATSTTWNIQYGTENFGLGTGTTVSANANPFMLTNLTANTTYDIYIQNDCANSNSSWRGPLTITTPCQEVAPYIESFTSYATPECWNNNNNNYPYWYFSTYNYYSGNNGNMGDNSTLSGQLFAYVDASYINGYDDISLTSPYVDVSALNQPAIHFFANSYAQGYDNLEFTVDFFDGAVWHNDVYTSNQNTDGWEFISIDLSSYTIVGSVAARFSAKYPETGYANRDDFAIDDIMFDEYDICLPITTASATNITYNSAELNWNYTDDNTSWNVQYGVTDFTIGDGTTVEADEVPYTLTGLEGATTYDVYIQNTCESNGNDSSWFGPITFITPNAPPPAPEGITCSENEANYLFTEEFDEVGEWTGNVSSTNGSAVWEIPGSSQSYYTGPYQAYSGDNYLMFESSGAYTGDTASAISPAIDLTQANEEAELSFYMFSYGQGMGTLDVGISTSATGPFTNIYSYIGSYQTSDIDPWVPIGINISEYVGNTVYIEFKQTAHEIYIGNGDMAIDYMRVQACSDVCNIPTNIAVSNITATTATLAWEDSNLNTNDTWEYIIQLAEGDEPTGNGTSTNSNSVNLLGLTQNSSYEVYVRSKCYDDFFSDWSSAYTFSTPIITDYTVDCTVGPTVINYCYANNENISFHFTASDNTNNLGINFSSGMLQDGNDQITVYDSDNTTVLYQGNGTDGDLSGLNYEATGAEIYVTITSNATGSCEDADEDGVPLTFSVNCTTCTAPTIDYVVNSDCVNSSTFTIDLDITDMGDATSLTISDSEGNVPQIITSTNTYSFGPYNNGDAITYNIHNNTDPNCSLISPILAQTDCPEMSISTDEYTIDELITEVFINSFCSEATNINWVGASTNGNNSIGYFENGYAFPIQEGIILSTGDITNAAGPNTTILSTSLGLSSDSDLEAVSGESNLNDASYIEFDFVPQVDHISFDYIFASEEYTSIFECNYSDIFAFILTDEDGNDTNIAVIPGTNTPIKVTTVHGDSGSGCGPINEEYFDQYNANGQGAINFSGQTVVLTAEADVTPGETYHLKLAIADATDSSYDSAVFLAASSLNLGFCPPDNTDLCDVTELTPVSQENEGLVASNEYQFLSASTEDNEPVPSCFANGLNGTLWFSFEAPDSGEVKINAYPLGGGNQVEMALYEAEDVTCSDLSTLGSAIACTSNNTSISLLGSNALTPGNTYYIQVNRTPYSPDKLGMEVVEYSCEAALYDTASVVADCENSQFFVDVNITDLGEGSPVITDGSSNWEITSTGTIQVGPFTDGASVNLTLMTGSISTSCDIDLGAFTNSCTPEAIECATNVVSIVNPTCGNYETTIVWDANSLASGYYLTVGTSTGEDNILSNEDLGNVTSYSILGTENTTYYYTVTPYDNNGNTPESSCTEYTFTTNANECYCESEPQNVDGNGITGVSINSSYINNGLNDETYVDYTNTTIDVTEQVTTSVQITLQTASAYDIALWIDYDNDMTFDDDELVGSATSTTANTSNVTISFVIPETVVASVYTMRMIAAPTGSVLNPCYNGALGSTLDFGLNVADFVCESPAFSTATVNEDCDNSEFYVDVTVTDIGNGAPAITDGTTNWPITGTGIAHIGPFEDATSAELTLTNGLDTTCDVTIGTFTHTCPIPCYVASYSEATINADCDNEQFYVDVIISDTGNGTSTITDGTNSWDITATGTLQVGPFQDGESVDLTLTGSDESCDTAIGTFTYTCPTPCYVASYSEATTNADCDNEQFYVDVIISDIGNGTSTITDGINSWNITTTGTLQAGPFQDGASVDLTLTGSDESCDAAIGTFTYTCPIPCVLATFETPTVIEDCDYNQFYVEVNITDLGNGTPSISDGSTSWIIPTTGIIQVGPFVSESYAELVLNQGDDNTCSTDLGVFTYACPIPCEPTTIGFTYINEDCDNNQFFVDVNITATGNGLPYITDGTDTWEINDVGAIQVGPFLNESAVTLSIAYEADTYCEDINLGTFTYACATPPANDDLCNAFGLDVLTQAQQGSTSGDAFTTVNATVEDNEPMPNCFTTTNGSVWFSFTAPESGEVQISTDIPGGSLTDTQIAVYSSTGVACDNLASVTQDIACDQDSGTNVPNNSTLQITDENALIPGATYYIQVDYLGEAGTFGIEVIELTPSAVADINTVTFNYYPNPVKNNKLNLQANMPINSIEVYNLLGQHVMYITPESNTYTLDMHQLASGNYIIKLIIGEHLKTIKITKE